MKKILLISQVMAFGFISSNDYEMVVNNMFNANDLTMPEVLYANMYFNNTYDNVHSIPKNRDGNIYVYNFGNSICNFGYMHYTVPVAQESFLDKCKKCIQRVLDVFDLFKSCRRV